MYAGVIRSAVHTAFRRSLAIATVHARFNLTQMTYEGRKKREGLHQIESYISKHSQAKFSHGMCPACGKQYYGELWPETSEDVR